MYNQGKTNLLMLENQLCFPIYAVSRLITRLYQPLLDEIGITYPQYLVLMVLWEEDNISVSEISERVLLNSNTLTPLLKRLEKAGIIIRNRSKSDERAVKIVLTDKGKGLYSKAECVPEKMLKQVDFPIDDLIDLKKKIESLLNVLKNH